MEANFLKKHIFPKEASLSVSSLDIVKIEATNANNISISKRKKWKKKWRKKKKFSDKNDKDKHDSYKGNRDMEEVYIYEDKICEFLNLNVKTLKYPAAPRYKISNKYTINKKRVFFKRQNKKNKRRYFAGELFKQLKSKKVDSLCLMPEIKQKYLFKTTADFNHQLIKDPNNIELWLNFVNFQDSTFKFDNLQQKQNSQKFIAEKKLAILDKALEANVMSEILIKERFRIAEYTLTREKLIEDLSDLLKKNPSSYILLSLLVKTTKNNVVHCTVPKVLGIFTQAIDQLHQSRRQLTNECVQIVEESMLAMLFECALFLQQAGLWEKLWTLLQLYLKLHVSNPSMFEVNMTIPENELFDEEDKILQSGLPLFSLWIKIERLRSSIHFLPVEKSEDLQRIVFPNDLTKLLHAFITPSIKFNLVLLIITALKVPLLPTRSSTLEIFNMLQIENIVYNVESVLPLVYSVGPSLDLNCSLYY
uniref:Uncharacterized protein n=1 Tax=Clastoptera arizonana TaxID=38151 RepID=A0A1B6DW55_9HEMI